MLTDLASRPCLSEPSSTTSRPQVPKIFADLPTCKEEQDYFNENKQLDLLSVVPYFKADELGILNVNGILKEIDYYKYLGIDLLANQTHNNTYFYKIFTLNHVNNVCSKTQF